ncbi:MAG: D-alanine--D-alanine ligase [Alphaproteobacteria bacterium]|nr:MAG: D-alanine--D-alanine ligase [Alphaproteobacteria bacterium]
MIKTVAILMGGWSPERQVSLDKTAAVEDALIAGGYDVRVINVTRDIDDFVAALTPRPDVVFNNLYGKGGEDGLIQGVLEMMQIPYTHSSVVASAVGMNKEITKNVASQHGVKVTQTLSEPYYPPYVVKPVDQGSSVDVTIVMDHDNFIPVTDDMMVERYVAGRELTCSVLDGRAQAVSEIVSATKFFDYEAKYNDTRTETILPAKIPKAVYEQAMEWSETIFNAIGAQGLARCDYRFDEGGEGLVFMEINTQPGCTADSIGPSQVVYNGMSFVDLCSHLVETACVKNK